MFSFRRFLAVFLLLLVAQAARADALPQPVSSDLFYKFGWGGLAIGSIHLSIGEAGGKYQMRSDIASSGLVKIFAPHVSHTAVEGARTPEGYSTLTYRSFYQTRKKKKTKEFAYAPDGTIKSEHSLPVDKNAESIAPELKKGSVDPLTALMEIRRYAALMQATGTKTYQFLMYDGTRLSRVTISWKGKDTVTMADKEIAVLHLSARREPLGGFSQKELKQMKSEPLLHIYLRDDATLLPVKIEVKVGMGMLTGILAAECGSGDCPAFTPMETYHAQWKSVLGE